MDLGWFCHEGTSFVQEGFTEHLLCTKPVLSAGDEAVHRIE